MSFQQYVDCIIKEQKINEGFLPSNEINSIYLGGGTPSLLPIKILRYLLNNLLHEFNLCSNNELTIEVNPDDISEEWINELKDSTDINRISIGIQSFNDDDLRLMNRRHDSATAVKAINTISSYYDNFSIDLIYGFPGQTLDSWLTTIITALSFHPKHISAYALSLDPSTSLAKMIDDNNLSLPEEEFPIDCYHLLNKVLKDNGYIHYEISNYCLPGYHSKHNWNYWDCGNYIGLGAGAHSYNGKIRKWNTSSIDDYITKTSLRKITYSKEKITVNTSYNEYIMLHLRTNKGININTITNIFGKSYRYYTIRKVEKIDVSLLEKCDNEVILNEKGFLFADGIASNFFIL